MLKNDEGDWVSDIEVLKSLALNYFGQLYCSEPICFNRDALLNMFLTILERDKVPLNKRVDEWEVKQALFNIGA